MVERLRVQVLKVHLYMVVAPFARASNHTYQQQMPVVQRSPWFAGPKGVIAHTTELHAT